MKSRSGSRRRRERRLQRTRLASFAAVLALWSLTLAACATRTTRPSDPVPRPVLESVEQREGGGICLDEPDTRELLLYIDQLEQRP